MWWDLLIQVCVTIICQLIPAENIVYPAVVEAPEVTLSGYGSGVAGTSYRLTCTVTLPSGVQSNVSDPPTVQWPELNTATNNNSQISTLVYVSSITLNCLQETYSGQYSCRASYSLGGISSKVVTDKINITVICKS